MYAGRRIATLRVTALAALAVSAILCADGLHPGRAFCPMAAACDKARSSALGRIFGIPTSVVGMAAFGGLFALSMLRVEHSRRLLRPAGFLAALVGAGLFAYQALVLHSFCPLCLVADTAGLVSGLIVLTWPRTPVRRSGRKLDPESTVAKLRWLAVAFAVVAAPFLWPRPQAPSWIAIPSGGGIDVAEFDAPEAGGVDASEPAAPPPHEAAPDDSTIPPPRAGALPRPGPPPPPPVIRPTPRPAPAPATPPREGVTIVEYVNAFCSHCRATHERLERVLREDGIAARRRRVYTWPTNDTPMWAKAVAFAAASGLEDRMFDELVRADDETPQEVYAAAQRAGVDATALQAALASARAWPRLDGDRRLAQGARLEGLPTLDIGRRRLMGEQSEGELREALKAATARPEPAR